VRLFVYGTLLSGEGNHRVLRGARLLGMRRTEPRYTLVSLGAFPALLQGGTSSIAGEVYEVDDATLAAVDRLEGHPHLYRRTAVSLLGGERVDGYVLARARRDRPPVIKSGDWRDYRCASKS
jgi:gamma-glutamylaminecyclotransferase